LNDFAFKEDKLDPAIAMLFGAFVVKGPTLEIDRIKRFILEETHCRLVFQHKDDRYLRIEVQKNCRSLI
jgi:hypothetical protein